MMEEAFDAIVIGSGISGGWVVKELTEKGLKTLLIESGRNVEHIKDYPTTNLYPWEFSHRGVVPHSVKALYKIASRNYIFDESTYHFMKQDLEQEYVQKRPYDWIRGDQVGGRSLLWGRQTQRWSNYDFEGPKRDGFATDWPIRYEDIAPWYSHVERFIGVSGNRDGLATLPDGEFMPPFEMTCLEEHFKKSMQAKYSDRSVIIARVANMTQPKQIHLQQGRSKCMNRDLCARGCPFGGYFSSNSSTIPWAQKTGNLHLLTNTIAHSIVYNEETGKADGVRVIDKYTKALKIYKARILFVNASTLNTNLILLNSKSNRFPNGIGNDNGLMGKFLAFHNYRGRVQAEFEGLKGYKTDGRRPGSSFMPRFTNVHKQEKDFLRGYNTIIGSERVANPLQDHVGEGLKRQITDRSFGNWRISAQMMGETIPKESSTATLDPVKKDKYGLPQLQISVGYDLNDEKMLLDFHQEFSEMFSAAGYININKIDTKRNPGNENHEMGGVRMGRDPKTSLLNRWNQLHGCKNVFVTDGSCMTSTSSQNPSLTYMALAARATNYAVEQFRNGHL